MQHKHGQCLNFLKAQTMYFISSADLIYMQDPYMAITVLSIKFPWLENKNVYNVIVSTDSLTHLGVISRHIHLWLQSCLRCGYSWLVWEWTSATHNISVSRNDVKSKYISMFSQPYSQKKGKKSFLTVKQLLFASYSQLVSCPLAASADQGHQGLNFLWCLIAREHLVCGFMLHKTSSLLNKDYLWKRSWCLVMLNCFGEK